MITQQEARKAIRAEYDNWQGRPDLKYGARKAAFYEWLKEFRSNLLEFPSDGDKRDVVITWLAGR